jgi:predicted Zn-dependent protease
MTLLLLPRNRSRALRGVPPLLATAVVVLGGLFSGMAAPARPAIAAAVTADNKDSKNKQPKPPAEDPEVKMGREAHEELLRSGAKIIRDPKIAGRVETIGKKVAQVANDNPLPATFGSSRHVRYDYKFFVIDEKEVNAYSLPGGYIYVTKGLYDYVQSDDELAGVLGHEVIHAAHHHVAQLQKQASRYNTAMLVAALGAILSGSSDAMNLVAGLQLFAVQRVNGHGQNAEKDADHAGVIVARQAGYNPVGALTVMERFARDEKFRPDIEQGIFRTHPPSRERADAMIAQIGRMGLPINRRDVTNAIKAAAQPAPKDAPAGAQDVILDGKLVFRTASTERARRTAETINRLLDADLQIYDVRKQGTQIVARGETLVAVEPEDARLVPGATPESVTDQAYRVLRNALYKQVLNNAY